MAAKAVALSTSDNPFNPLTQYDDWYAYDAEKRYFTCDYLDRVCHTTKELGEELYANDIEKAIDEAVKFDLISWIHEGVHYVKVVED